MILQIAPLIDQISVLGGVVIPIVDVGCQTKCPAMVKVGRFRKPIGEAGVRAWNFENDRYKIIKGT